MFAEISPANQVLQPLLIKISIVVNVKWGKQMLSGIECDTTEDVLTFKAVL